MCSACGVDGEAHADEEGEGEAQLTFTNPNPPTPTHQPQLQSGIELYAHLAVGAGLLTVRGHGHEDDAALRQPPTVHGRRRHKLGQDRRGRSDGQHTPAWGWG